MISEKKSFERVRTFRLFVCFFFLLIFYSGFGQKMKYKDFVFDNDKSKHYGEIFMREKFWSRGITLWNKEEGIAKICRPDQIRKFVKGDSTFISVNVNNTLGVGINYTNNHFALVIIINDSMNLYKTYAIIDKKPVEVFLYYKPGMRDIKVIRDEKSSIIDVVENCKPLVEEIKENGFEYSEQYMRDLTVRYNKWAKDSTISIEKINVSGLDSAQEESAKKTIFLTDKSSDILRFTTHDFCIIGVGGVLRITSNRYYYKGDFKQPFGIFGGRVRPIVQQFNESEKYLNTYRNLRIAGLLQMCLAPALFIKAVSVDPEGNSVDYWLASSIVTYISGRIFYCYIAPVFLRKSVRSFNKSLLEKRYREQLNN